MIVVCLFLLVPNSEAGANREGYPLRPGMTAFYDLFLCSDGILMDFLLPELIESVMYLYRATGDSYLLEIGEDMLRSIQHSAKTSCGFATVCLHESIARVHNQRMFSSPFR